MLLRRRVLSVLRRGVLFALLLAGPAPVSAAGAEGELRVVVRDARTGIPLEGAEVTAVTNGTAFHGTTDAGGVVMFRGEAGAIVRVSVHKDDYLPAVTRTIVHFGTWHARKLVFRLPSTGEDEIRIVDRAVLVSLDESAHVTVFSKEFLDDLPLRDR